ncbi:hypothetical protein L486_00780 [Kwoniella mangroviensis CBS 10435]|uniref:Arrestin C-terminal-like domain-containing protein n=1 Tax=Kwoniella mangroviensis CBS 10435 TaxID=1331196 RepID=A0A1B9J029_9TREE|nr:hypothetical protein L486_00780 [Kwoniella mangroviensis CBS 10435]
MSHPARLLLRAPPHLPFIQGHPGIPASPDRKAAGVHGSLELRVGSIPVKAKWVRVEIRKYESLPPGFPNTGGSSSEPVWEHIGEINTLWKPSDESKETEQIETADFKFFLPLPENVPPSVELPRSTGIRYELVAALCYKQKSGLFKKESYPILKISEPLIVIKHDLHSSWPLYNIPDSKTIKASNDQLTLNVSRPNTAFSSGDRIQFSASLKSTKSQPFKLKGFECTIYELITSIPIPPDPQGTKGKKRKSLQNPITKSRPISTVKAAVDERIGLGGEKSAKIEMLVDRVLVTVKNARTLRVEYALEVKAVMEGIRDKIEINGIMYTVGVFDRNTAEQATGDIGRVDFLCPDIPQPSPPPRPIDSTPFAGPQPDLPPNARFNGNSLLPGPGYFPSQRPTSGSYNQQQQPQQPMQGFDSRQPYQRHASSNSASTFTTTDTQTNEFGMTPTPTQNRSYATMPTLPGQRRPEAMFPTAHPRPRSVTPTSPTHDSASGHERYVQSDAGHDTSSNRYSTATMATFGRWDKGLKNAMKPEQESDRTATSLASSDNAITPTTPTVPSPSTRQSSPMPVVVSRPTSARPPVPPSSFYLSSEQEKTLQRERYEAARNAAGLLTSSQTTKKDEEEIPEIPPPEYAPPVPAQPKRQYAAPSRPVSEYTSLNGSSVNSGPKTTSSPRLTSPSPATRPSSGSNRMGSPPPPSIAEQTGLLSAAEEKEIQRKRYEAATSRVAETNTPPPKAGPSKIDVVKANSSSSPNRQSSIIQALKTSPPLFPRKSSQGSTSEGPMPYTAIYPPDRTSSKADGSTPVGLGISANGLSEKEQMKRYYEAQEAVAQNQNQSNPNSPSRMINVGSSSVLTRKSGGGSVGSIVVNEQGQRTGQGGPIDEKEQMRRYYEAQDRVASASGSGQSPARPSKVTNLHNQNRDVSRPSSPSGSKPPTSASDEKEQMRRYYEAQDRVAAAARGENSAGTSTSTSQNAKQDTLPSGSAVDEKEQMRRYYEAQEKVAARTGSPPPVGPSGYTRQTTQTPSPTKPKTDAAVPAPIDEKEQMRRYYEAQDRVAAASRGESSGTGMQQSPPRSTHRGSHAASPTRPKTSAAASYVIDEKEQIRRYYEARDRVARASQSPGIGSSSNNRISDTPTASPTKPRATSTIPTALNEKEQMRRYYEAQDRVARAGSGSPQPGSSRSATGTGSVVPSSSSGGVSAIDEKEQMKRYYEAMDRVNRASDTNGSPSRARQSTASPPPPPVLAPPVESPTFDEAPPSFAEGSSNNAGTASASGSGSGIGYPSAEQEKEMMKKRYEQATSAVQRYNSPSPPPPETSSLSTAATNPFMRSLTNQPRTSLGSASEQIISNKNSAGSSQVPKGDDRGYFGSNDSSSPATSPPSSPFLARDPTIKAGKARAIDGSTTSNAPPPPLPARPPKEYVELLSPV